MYNDFTKYIKGIQFKNCIEIKIDGEPFICLEDQNGEKWIETKISKFFRVNKDDLHMIDINITEQKLFLYPLKVVINNLRARTLKQLVSEGLFNKDDNTIKERDKLKERQLSTFDKMILKAANYRPKNKQSPKII